MDDFVTILLGFITGVIITTIVISSFSVPIKQVSSLKEFQFGDKKYECRLIAEKNWVTT